MDKLSAIMAFVNVAETGSFTAAASKLGLPKARISQRVKDLEHELDIRLFERSTRKVRMTAAGAEYYEECRELLLSLERVEKNLQSDSNTPGGRIVVDVLSPFVRWVIAPRLTEFYRKYPDIQVSLTSSDTLVNLFQESVDLVIRGGALDNSSLIARPLCLVPFQLYASPDVARMLASQSFPDVLDSQPLLSWFPDDDKELRWVLHHHSSAQVIKSKRHFWIGDQDSALEMASTGAGICPGMYLAADNYVRQGKLVPVLDEWRLTPRQVTILYPSRAHLPKKVRCFIEWLTETVQDIDFEMSH